MVSKVLKLVALVGAGASLYLMTGDNSNCKNYIKKRNKILKNKNNLSIMKEGLNRIYSVNAEYADDLKEHVKEIDEDLTIEDLIEDSQVLGKYFTQKELEFFYSDMILAVSVGLSEAFLKNKWSCFDMYDIPKNYYPRELKEFRTREDFEIPLGRMKRKKHITTRDEELILDLYDNFKEPVLNNSYLYVDINLIESDLNCSELTYPFDFNDSKYSLLNVINMIENS